MTDVHVGQIIGVTGNALQEDIDIFYKGGVDMVMIKPLNMEEFLSYIYGEIYYRHLLCFIIDAPYWYHKLYCVLCNNSVNDSTTYFAY